jgi:hypothetical protein
MLVCASALAQGCGPTDPATARRDEIVAILEMHLEHQDAILGILERQRDDPRAAAAELDAYLAEHGVAIDELCDKRRLLEADPNALAAAMRILEPAMSRVFERRLALSQQAPELMAREEVRTALAALDPL